VKEMEIVETKLHHKEREREGERQKDKGSDKIVRQRKIERLL
jgi:hypothetical protein